MKRHILKSAAGKGTGQGPKETVPGATSCPLQMELCGQCLFLPATLSDNMHRILPTTEAQQVLGPRFICEVSDVDTADHPCSSV